MKKGRYGIPIDEFDQAISKLTTDGSDLELGESASSFFGFLGFALSICLIGAAFILPGVATINATKAEYKAKDECAERGENYVWVIDLMSSYCVLTEEAKHKKWLREVLEDVPHDQQTKSSPWARL